MIKSALRITALLSALYGSVAYGQNAQPVIPLVGGAAVSGSNPLPVSGSFSASLGGFMPSAAGARGTPLSVTNADSSGSLPTGTVVIVSNVGTNLMYCNVNGVAATASDQPITTGGGWFAFTIPMSVTTLHCIAPAGTAIANTLGGSGLPTGTGGGGGGGGSSGAVFGPTAAGSAAANPPVIIGGTVDGTAAGNVANWKVTGGIGSINTAQVNGVTTLAGAGAVGTGALRVAVGQDTTTLAGSALGLTVGSPLFMTPGTGASFAVTNAGTFATQLTGATNAVNATLSAETTKIIGTVNPGNTANTTAWLVTGTGGSFPAIQSGNWTSRIVGNAGSILDFNGQNATSPAGALESGCQFNTSPSTISNGNSSPVQCDNLGSTIVNVRTGTLSASQSGAWNITNITGTVSLPTLAATSTLQTSGGQKTQIVDGSGNVIASTSNNLNVQCANCSGSGVSTADEATYTPAVSLFAGGGGFFQTTATSNALTNGTQGMFQVTANRALFSNLRNAAGTEVGTAGTPLQVSIANTGANGTAIVVNSTLSAETTKVIGTVRNLGNAGAITDFAGQNASSPANAWLMGAQFQTTPTTITPGNASPLQMDNAGNLLVNLKVGALPTGAATAANQATEITSLATIATNSATAVPCLPAATFSTNTYTGGTPSPSNCTLNGVLYTAVVAQPRATRNYPGCTVGTSSASCLAATTAIQFLEIHNPITNTVNIACAFGATAVLGASTSITLAPGQPASWGPNTAGVPAGQMNCIAGGASTPLYVEWL